MIVEDFNCSLVDEPVISKNKIRMICFVFIALAFIYACLIELNLIIKKETGKK
jgi:hypothetical protein